MKLTKDNFLYFFNILPELLFFLHRDIEASADYQSESRPDWADDLYTAARESLEQAQQSITQAPGSTLLKQLRFDTRSIELERTILGLVACASVYEGDYNFFATVQTKFGKPITEKQFAKLKTLTETNFNRDQRFELELMIVLHDLGKIKPIKRYLARLWDIQQHDPDQFICAVLQRDYVDLARIFPSIAKLPEDRFEAFVQNNVDFHFGHFQCGESTEGKLEALKAAINKHGIRVLNAGLCLQLYDLAGASAHESGKILLNESIFESYYKDVYRALRKLETASTQEALHHYYKQRLSELPGYQKLHHLTHQSILFARVICLLRIHGYENLIAAKTALAEIESVDFDRDYQVIRQYQADSRFETPTYMPTLINAVKAHPRLSELANDNESPFATALRISFRVFAQALQQHQDDRVAGKLAHIHPVNFNFLVALVNNDFDAFKAASTTETFAIDRLTGKCFPKTWHDERLDTNHQHLSHVFEAMGLSFDQQKSFRELLTLTRCDFDLSLESNVFANAQDALTWLRATTQLAWLRKPGSERWDCADTEAQQRQSAVLLTHFESLGLVSEVKPSEQHYQHTLLLGALESRVISRAAFTKGLLEEGLQTDQVNLLGGKRELYDDREQASIEALKAKGQTELTELTMMRHVVDEQSKEWPASARNTPIVDVDTPMQATANGGTRRPNTQDTIKTWQDQSPDATSALAVSNQPFIQYQHAVVRSVLPKEIQVETVGHKASSVEKISVYLDSVARWIYADFKRLEGELASSAPSQQMN